MSQEEVAQGNVPSVLHTTSTSGGDAVGGDKVLDDKIQGDKIGRDKIVYTRSEVNELDDYLQKAVSRFETRMFQLLRPHPQPGQPYKFLYPFMIEDRDIFFGRQTAVEELYHVVQKDQLTILHGRSGSGKTSLLNAGLSPNLIENCCLPVYARAYEDPLSAIKQAIAPPSLGPWPELFKKLQLDEFLGLACIHLSRQIKELVIILDQFEEFFIFPPENDIRRPFITDLAACINDKNLPIRFVIAIRKDYYSDLADFKCDIPTIFFNEYRLNLMTRAEAESAVICPVARHSSPITYEPKLVETLLTDLLQAGIELPHLQIICSRLYASLEAGHTQITSESYARLGGAEGILGSYLTTELKKLPGRQCNIAKEILKELVSSEATKRVLPYETLAARINAHPDTLDETLTRLVNARLLQRWETAGIVSFEMAHEYLISEIGRWIDQNDLKFKHIEELLARETTTWRIHGTLIPGERLALLLPHREKLKNSDADARLTLYLSALRSHSEEIRLWAVTSLGQLGDSRAVGPLIDALVQYYGSVRDSVTQALSQLGEPAVAPLLAALKDEKIQVRSSAADALGQIGGLALEPLILALQDEDQQVRSNAARALGQLGSPQAVQPLINALKDQTGPVRYMAAGALARLDDNRAVPPLVAALNDDDWRVRDRAAKALGLLNDSRAVCPLINALGDKDGRVRERATEALHHLSASTFDSLINALLCENGYIRAGAVKLLGMMGDSRAVEPLIAILGDENDSVRSAAAESLGRLKNDRTVELLKAALKDNNEQIRRGAAQTLGRLGIMEVDLLIAALNDEDWSVRRNAAVALGQLGDSKAIDPLVCTLMDNDWRVRSGAAVSLGQFGELAVAALLNALNTEGIVINKSTAVALRMIGTPEALAPLNEYNLGR
jgi:HEAT repeat protein